MSRQRRISYMIDPETNMVYSRVGSEVAIPVLDFGGMKPENGYKTNYNLEKFDVIEVVRDINRCIGTRKIPTEIKNQHRMFWEMKPLKV